MEEKENFLLEENRKLKHILRKIFPKYSKQYFICGEAGSKDHFNLPEKIFICPQSGLAGFAVYTKEKDYSEPGY